MPTCSPVLGVGVRHIQYLIFALMVALDYWLQALTLDGLMTRVQDVQQAKTLVDSEGYNAPPFAVEIGKTIRISVFCAFASGRLLSGFLVTKFTNKYFLVAVTIIETTMSILYYWFLFRMNVFEYVLIPTTVAFFRSFHWTFLMNILAKWMPAFEFTTANAIIVVVRDIGTSIFSFYLSGLTYTAAKIVLLLVMFTYIVWIAVFVLFGADGPDTSYLLSKHEMNFLGRHVGPRKRLKCNAKTPWKNIFGTWFLYGWMIADFGRECALTAVAEGFRIALQGQLAQSVYGLQAGTGLFYIAFLVIAVYTDRILMKEKMTPSQIRKIYSSIGCCGLSISMILAAYVADTNKKFVYLMICTLFSTIMACGQPVSLFDVSPNYAAPIFAVFTFFRMLLFIVKTYIDEFIISGGAVSEVQLNQVFYRYGFLVFLTNLIFLMSGDIELKPFDKFDTKDWRKESILSYP